MGMADKVGGGYVRRKIVAVETRDNRARGDIYTGIWIRRQRRRGVGDRRDVVR